MLQSPQPIIEATPMIRYGGRKTSKLKDGSFIQIIEWECSFYLFVTLITVNSSIHDSIPDDYIFQTRSHGFTFILHIPIIMRLTDSYGMLDNSSRRTTQLNCLNSSNQPPRSVPFSNTTAEKGRFIPETTIAQSS